MQKDEDLIKLARTLIEERLKWGRSEEWTTQDFEKLSEQIGEKSGVHLSTATLKRLWGRVAYSSAPSLTTLDALALFIDFENWREFKRKHVRQAEVSKEDETEHQRVTPIQTKIKRPTSKNYFRFSVLFLLLAGLIYASYSFLVKPPKLNAKEYGFDSKKVVTEGVPNSVVFNIDAQKAPYDSVEIQQTWDSRRRVSVPKSQKQHTAIYYYPGNFTAKLLLGGSVVKEHNLLIKSGGWLPIIEQDPIPIYLKKEDAIKNGKMKISFEKATEKLRGGKAELPNIYFYNTQDFGEIYTDDFVFETLLKNEYKEAAGVCRKTFVMLQCVDNMIRIPVSARGCISEINLAFTSYYSSGKKEDLSAFGVYFSSYVKLCIVSKEGLVHFYINEKPVYVIRKHIDKAKLIGIAYCFQGAGSVDYVKLSNNKVHFEDTFDK